MEERIRDFIEYLKLIMEKEKEPLEQAKILQAMLDLKKIINK